MSQGNCGTTAPQGETIAPGLDRAWLENGRIVQFTIETLTRQAMDQWVAAVWETIDHWKADTPYLGLHVVCSTPAGFTPYIQQRVRETFSRNNEVPGRTAVVLPRTLVLDLVRIFFRFQRRGAREWRIFYRYDEALAWLKEAL